MKIKHALKHYRLTKTWYNTTLEILNKGYCENIVVYRVHRRYKTRILKYKLVLRMKKWKIEKLENGETFKTSEKGNSMTPIIKSGQEFVLAPITLSECQIGDIIYCKVHGRMFTHLVKAIDDKKGLQIGNNHGYINGWTKTVYGKVIEVL